MSEISGVGSAASVSLGPISMSPNTTASAAPSGNISMDSSQISISSSQSSQTSFIASNYSSGYTSLSEVGDKMMAVILALLDFLYGNKDDDKKKQSLLSLMALAGSSHSQYYSSVQFNQSFSISQSSISSTQIVQSSIAGSAYGQTGAAYSGGEMGSGTGGSIDTSA